MQKSIKAVKEQRKHSGSGALFREFILGGQDGLVNVLGIVLGISIATGNVKLVMLAAFAACFAEAFSMAAVAYTSAKAEEDYYSSMQEKELCEIREIPEKERKEIYDIYYKKGFRGKLLNDIVKHITADKKIWLNIMMKEELNLSSEFTPPIKSAIIVGLSTIIGSLIPVVSFFFLPINDAIIGSLIISAASLFITGALEAKTTVGSWVKKGINLMIIGMIAAFVGFLIGKIFGA
jgi:vacuolar iron transporter family protein